MESIIDRAKEWKMISIGAEGGWHPFDLASFELSKHRYQYWTASDRLTVRFQVWLIPRSKWMSSDRIKEMQWQITARDVRIVY